MDKKQVAIVIGRFQPFHKMHKHLVNQAYKKAANVVILVGSAGRARSIKNPFSFNEVKAMINKEFPNAKVLPIYDHMYDDAKWVAQVQSVVSDYLTTFNWTNKDVVLVGHKKDSSSFYLSMFPGWDYHEVQSTSSLSATTIRQYLFSAHLDQNDHAEPFLKDMLSETVFNSIKFFTKTQTYLDLVEEYDMVEKYKAAWAAAPYKPTFVTTDAVVTCGGHVLMIKRGFSPGKGLWALPGGFLEQGERITSGIIRELKEETGINLGRGILDSYMKEPKVFDHPGRSLRGRTITHAALISLPFTALPEVKGDDDAVGAMWIPFADLLAMRDQVFEDHLDIVSALTGAI